MPNKDADSYMPVSMNSFQGGTTISKKLGIANSFYYSQNLDFRSDPSQMSVLPGARTISSTLSDTITAMDQDLSGVRWGVGNNGGLYKINTSNVISKEAQLTENGSAGLYYFQVSDQLYIPGQTAVSMFGQVTTGNTGQPSFRSNQFAQSASTAPGCCALFNPATGQWDATLVNQSVTGAGYRNYFEGQALPFVTYGITEAEVYSGQVTTNSTQTYLIPNVIQETSTTLCGFSPDIEPFYSIMVYITNAGTGNWTLTLHDSLNTPLATVTLSNATIVTALTTSSYVEFAFGKQVRALINASQTGQTGVYHFHLTSSVTSDTAAVGTLNPNDLSSADFLLFAYRLVATKNGWHPTAYFTGGGTALLCIGNGPYLATYNFGNDSNPGNGQFQRSNLVLKQGYEVCGLTTCNQYLVIAVERRSTNSSKNAQDGGLYLWDGTTNAPSIFQDIPMGSPYGIFSFNNIVYFACAGSLYAYTPGGSSIIKVRKLAYQNTDYLGAVDSTIINPNMFTSRYNIMMIGYPSTTTNPNINYGVWSWGTVELTFPNSYGLSYTLANNALLNNASPISNLQIGCVQNFVDSMYISWSYTLGGQTYYGMDLVDNFSTSATSYSWQSLYYDGGVSYKIKQVARIKVKFLSFPSGCTLQLGYSLDRGSWKWLASASTGNTGLTIDINQRFHELQWGIQGTTTGVTTVPTITGFNVQIDAKEDESNMTKGQ